MLAALSLSLLVAVASPDATALYRQGLAAYNGQGMPKDGRMAALLFRQSADLGYAPAQLAYGLMALSGQGGLSNNRAEAVAWVRKAAVQGLPEAQHSMGAAYFRGIGVKPDVVEACAWETRASRGDAQYQATLKVMTDNMTPAQRDACHARAVAALRK